MGCYISLLDLFQVWTPKFDPPEGEREERKKRGRTHSNSSIKRRNHTQAIKQEPVPTPRHPKERLIRQLRLDMSLALPRRAEPDMRKTDGAPDEEVREARQRKQPVENRALLRRFANEGEEPEEELQRDAVQWAAFGVHVCELPGSHAALGKRLHRAGGAEGAGVGDADDGDGDDGVEDGGEDLDPRELDRDDEGRVFTIGSRRVEQVGIITGNDQAEDEQRNDVEEGDAPEDLLSGHRDRFAWVGSFGGCETDQFGPSEGESCDHEDRTEPLEAIHECAWVVPIFCAEVSLAADSTAVNDDAQNDESDTA